MCATCFACVFGLALHAAIHCMYRQVVEAKLKVDSFRIHWDDGGLMAACKGCIVQISMMCNTVSYTRGARVYSRCHNYERYSLTVDYQGEG